MHFADIEKLNELLFVDAPAPRGEVALVFGTAHHPAVFARAIAALWGKRAFERLIISGYRGEAEQLAEASIAQGVPEARIELETKASNTGENVAFSLPLLNKAVALASPGADAARSLIGIGKSYSARRCLLTLKKYLPDWGVHMHAVDYFGITPETWLRNPAFVDKVIEELTKIPLYAARGYIAPPAEAYFQPPQLAILAEQLAAWRETLTY